MLGKFASAALVMTGISGGAQAQEADGMTAYNNHCRQCHSYKKDDNRLGPSLYGIVGDKAGGVEGFAYSESVKDSGVVWDEATLDKWIADPNAVIPGSNMGSVYAGLEDEAQRKLIIEFLKSDAAGGEGEAASN